MARRKGNFEHGTVSRYRQGDCSELPGVIEGQRCLPCKKAMSDSIKFAKAGSPPKPTENVVSIEGRARSNGKPAQSNSRPSVSNPEPIIGDNERWVITQFEQYRKDHGLRVQLLQTLARVMDDEESKGIWPTTARQMEMIIKEITAKKKTKTGGRMAAVSAMAGRKSG